MQSSETLYAVCILREDGNSGVNGVVKMRQQPGKDVEIKTTIKGLSAGKHGFHIHQYGNLLEGCKTAGPHFNPVGCVHGGPNSQVRHHGDLGNLFEKKNLLYMVAHGNGEQTWETTDRLVKIQDVVGRSFVVHAGEDDLGLGTGDKADESKKTGNAGARLACGTIGLSGELQW
ncbi:Superoxide dismutase, copper/zinc binding domain [Pseudocohnilembus persalinus]|uniref:Superoxide dismutase [Cu-Zn] n=1 Tax=Pseudocohnilembus persalinus TaxID=266149 RepID=A0A0V0QF20_PSEPJ|nr:Superoxide dismutase, copper/zinc binding domain [Pseudocohnilembus persalinus]|eukprot:KRX00788.1 Superoxide dismutase, copper/zinc binding domain [Pseudocohnilembus persalinus]